jgi:tRNA(fMet)-specific endonuclease VapC
VNAFLESPRVMVLAVSEATADFYARVYRALKRKGKPIPVNDLWIAATALQHGFAVYTYDQHFREVEGLIVGCSVAEFLP